VVDRAANVLDPVVRRGARAVYAVLVDEANPILIAMTTAWRYRR
jgi:hypothetical protein